MKLIEPGGGPEPGPLHVRFPVKCPQCGSEVLAEYPIPKVAKALLTRENPLILSSPCHGLHWPATQTELDQIQEYLGAILDSLPPPPKGL